MDNCIPTVKIVIAAHKEYKMPTSDIYLPLQVGAEGKDNWNVGSSELEYAKDNTGENISEKNASFCELTGLYWAWKNLEMDYVGLVHYRRHFSYQKKAKEPLKNVLNDDEAVSLCAEYKIILPPKQKYYIETLYSHYEHTHYSNHLDITRSIIQEKYPEYTEFFDRIVKERQGYMFNMMIMKKELLNEYCSWLFSILFELEKRINVSELSLYQGRCYGRISEIIFNVWLAYQISCEKVLKSEIKEISCIYMEKVNWLKKGAAFLKAKFFHIKYEGSF